jgi:superoxide dismutase, Cu-Zn family
MRSVAILIILVGLAFAQFTDTVLAQAGQATAELKNAAGQVVGNATFNQQASGVQVRVQVTNIESGMHGIHIHAVGKCDGPDFTTAGGHFNPGAKQHGLSNVQGPHAGDLPNLQVGANRAGSLTVTNALISLGAFESSLIDTDGSALVIHANPDDNQTDPTGNSGGRMACGVIAMTAALPRTGEAPFWPVVSLLGVLLVVSGLAVRHQQMRRV